MIRTLVVDDDFMVADVHRRLVDRETEFTVVGVAHTASEAIASVAALQPDLVLLDLYLPDRSGLDVLTALRVTGATCDVLVISASRDVEAVRSVMRLGGLHFLIKPFDSESLRAQLQRVARIRRSGAELGSDTVNQSDVDAAFATLRALVPVLPKGLSVTTLAAVTSALGSPGDHSSTEVASVAGISRASARRYLEYLVATGAAERTLRYGSTGRPEHRYRPT